MFAILISSYTYRDLLSHLIRKFVQHDSKIYIAFDGNLNDESQQLIDDFRANSNVIFLVFEENVGKVMNLKRSLDYISEKYVTIFDEDDMPESDFILAMNMSVLLLNLTQEITSVSFYRKTDGQIPTLLEPEITTHYESLKKYPEIHSLFITKQLQASLNHVNNKGFWPESIFLKQYTKLGGQDLRLPIFIASGDYSPEGLTKNNKKMQYLNRDNMISFYKFSLRSGDALFVKIKRVVQLIVLLVRI